MLLEKSNNDSFRTEKARVVLAFERDYLQKMLDLHQCNITHAARAAAKNRRAFWNSFASTACRWTENEGKQSVLALLL